MLREERTGGDEK